MSSAKMLVKKSLNAQESSACNYNITVSKIRTRNHSNHKVLAMDSPGYKCTVCILKACTNQQLLMFMPHLTILVIYPFSDVNNNKVQRYQQ